MIDISTGMVHVYHNFLYKVAISAVEIKLYCLYPRQADILSLQQQTANLSGGMVRKGKLLT